MFDGGGLGEEGGGGKGGGELKFSFPDIATEGESWLAFVKVCISSPLLNNKFKVSQIFFWYRFSGSL